MFNKDLNKHERFFRYDRDNNPKRMRRRGFPIHAYIGMNGAGKSLMMVYDTLPSLDYGRPVLSTVRLLDWRNPRPCDDPTCTFPSHPDHMAAHPLFIPLKSYQQLIDFRDGDVLLDEVTGVVSARSFDSLPQPIYNMLVQLRRRNIALRWTAPTFARCDKILREVTQAATLCTPSFSLPKKSQPGEPPSLWRERYIIKATTVDASILDEADTKQIDVMSITEPLISQYFVRQFFRVKSYAMTAYDTYDDVLTVGHSDVFGTCMSCGGRRNQEKCKCKSHPVEAVDLAERMPSAAQQDQALLEKTGFLLFEDN